MGVYIGNDVFTEEIYQFETTDLVLGGPTGIDNKPLKELADRTIWLRNALRGFSGVTTVTGNVTLTKDQVFQKMVMIVVASGTAVVNLPNLTVDDAGLRISMTSFSAKQVSIVSPVNINFGSAVNKTTLFIADTEKIDLVWIGTEYIVLDYSGNMLSVGDFNQGYQQKQNTIIADGSLLLRSEYPRLFEFVQGLGDSLVSDTLWNTNNELKGFFTLGTTSANFRLPDLRGMFIRSLDIGRGLSFGRNYEFPGGYEADELKSHTHSYVDTPGRRPGSGTATNAYENSDTRQLAPTTATGGNETRPKNIGLLPLINI